MLREVACPGARRISAPAAAAVALALAAVLAGCGGGGAGRHAGTAGSGGMMGGGQGSMHMGSPTAPPATTTTPGTTTPPASDGRSVFLASGCAGCHTLAAAGATGTAGPNLDEARPSYARVVSVVTDGSGSMPAFGGTLSDSQIRSVARFVAGEAG